MLQKLTFQFRVFMIGLKVVSRAHGKRAGWFILYRYVQNQRSFVFGDRVIKYLTRI